MKKLLTYAVVVATIVWSMGLAAVIPMASAAYSPVANDIVKIKAVNRPAVYIIGSDLKPYVFSTRNTYGTWFDNFSALKYITQAEFDAMTLGGNVTIRSGSLMKFDNSDNVYAAVPGNKLCKLPADADAKKLYGANYASRVLLIQSSFVGNYTIDPTCALTVSSNLPDGTLIQYASSSDIWYISGGQKRLVSNEAFLANGFKTANIVTGVSTSMSYNSGTSVTGKEDGLSGVTVTGQGGNGGGGTVSGNLSATLAADTPAGATVPAGATNVAMLKFNITGSGTVNQIILKRNGLGLVTDFTGVYLYNGSTRLTNGRSIASDSNTVTFANLNVTAPATLTVVADINTLASGLLSSGQDSFSVIQLNNSTVNVVGNTFGIGTVGVSNATIDPFGGNTQVTLGSSQAEVAHFKITAGNNDVIVNRIALRNGGALANTNLANLNLMVNGATVGTAAAMTGDKAIITLTTPLTIAKSQSKNFTLAADITGGRTSDNIKFYVDENSDMMVLDSQYGFGAQIVNNLGLGSALTVSLAGGQITLAFNGPTATTYSVNNTNQILMKLSFSSERNITVKNSVLKLSVSTSTQATKIKNIKLVDLDSGYTLVGPISDLSSFTASTTATGADYSKSMGDTFDVSAGATRHLAIEADFDTLLADGTVMTATLDLSGANAVYDNDSGEYVMSSKIVPSALSGQNITASTANVTITKSSIPSSSNQVKGASNIDALGITFAAGTSGDLKLDQLTARVYVNSTSSWAVPYGDVDGNQIVSTISLWDGTTQVGQTKSLSLSTGSTWASGAWYTAQFNNLNYAIPAGTQKKLVAKITIRNINITGTYYVSVDADKADMQVENSQGNLLTIASALVNTNHIPVISVSANGGMTAYVDNSQTSPKADIAVTNVSGIPFTVYRFHPGNESFTITGLKIVDNNSAYDVDTPHVILQYVDASGATVTKEGDLSGGSLIFSDGQLAIPLPVNVDTYVTIKANTNSITNNAISGDAVKLGIEKASGQFSASGNLADTFIVVGQSSGQKLYGNANTIAMDDSGVVAQTLRKTKVVATNNLANGNSVVSQQNQIGVYNFASTPEPGSGQKSTLKQVNISISGSLANPASTTDVAIYSNSSFSSTYLMGTGTVALNGSSTAITLTGNNQFDGSQNVYVVTNDTTGSFASGYTGTKSLGTALTGYLWDDGTGASVSPIQGVPVVGATLSY